MGKKRKHKKKKVNGGIKYPQAKASAVSSTHKKKPSKPKFQPTVSNIKEFKPVGSGQKKPAGRKVTKRNLPKSKFEVFFVQLANEIKGGWSRFQKQSPLKKITIIFSSSLVLLLLGSMPDLWQIYLTYNPPSSATEQVADDTTTESTAFSAGEELESTTDASSATATTDPPVSTTEMPTTTRRAMPIIADAWLEEIDDKEFMTVNKNEWFKISYKYTGDASLIKWMPVDDEKDGVKKISDDEWVAICHSAGDAILVCEVNGEPKKAIFVKAIVPVKRIHVEGFSLSIGETKTPIVVIEPDDYTEFLDYEIRAINPPARQSAFVEADGVTIRATRMPSRALVEPTTTFGVYRKPYKESNEPEARFSVIVTILP